MELQNASSALALLFNTKAQNRDMALKVMQEVKEGNISAVKLHCYIKSIEDLIKSMLDSKGEFQEEYKNLVLNEGHRYGKSFKLYGCEMNIRETGIKYSYHTCNDEVLKGMYAQLEELENAIKQREEFLKHLPESGVACTETGSILYPPIKTSTTTLAVTLPKK